MIVADGAVREQLSAMSEEAPGCLGQGWSELVLTVQSAVAAAAEEVLTGASLKTKLTLSRVCSACACLFSPSASAGFHPFSSCPAIFVTTFKRK